MTAEPLFKNCNVEFVPIVDFEFVETCEIPDLPLPTFDCAPPLCPLPEPPIPCPTLTADDVAVTVTAAPRGCATGTSKTPNGKIKINQAADDCQFAIGLDLNIPIELPPCPVVTVTTKTDDNATKISSAVNPSGGDCASPDCKIEIVITTPPILTVPDINTFINTNINTFIETYVNTNIDTFIEIIGPTIITYINPGGGGGGALCIPKYKGGKINVCESNDKTGSITITNEKTDKHCQIKVCSFSGGNEITFGENISSSVSPTLIDQHPSCPVIITQVQGGPTITTVFMDDCWCNALNGQVKTKCENLAQESDPAKYCADLGGQLFTGPCGQTKKCDEFVVSGKICVPPAPCVPTYYGGKISVSLSDDTSAEAGGSLSLGAPNTAYKGCYFDPMPETNFEGLCVQIGEPGGPDTAEECRNISGTPCYDADCTNCKAGCDDKEISGTLTLPQSLCEVEFESGQAELTPIKCETGTKPQISVAIAKNSDNGKYKITVSGTYCDCCGGATAETDDAVELAPEESG